MKKYTNPASGLHRLVVMLGLAAGAVPAYAAHPGDLDPAFGQGGQVISDFYGTEERIHALAPMRDGRFVAAGFVVGPNGSGPGSSENVVVARYLPNGTIDQSFATAGFFNYDLGGGPDRAAAVKVMPDNGVLVAATLTPGAYADFGLIKLRADGSLDTTFGEPNNGERKGYVRLDIGGASIHDDVFAMATQRDGRIVVAGYTRIQVPNGQLYTRVAVARFTATGEVDTSFGGAGTGFIVLPKFFADEASDYLTGIALTQSGQLPADDRITLVGYTFGRNNAFIARLTANGTPDATFGNGGRVTLQDASSGGVRTGVSTLVAARIAADGRLVVLGEGGDRGMAVLRFTAAGAPDTSFGTNGRTLIKFSGISDYDEPAALALQGNGKIVAAGYATNRATGAPRNDFFVGRLLANGALDAGFGDGQGRAVVQVSTEADEAYAVEVEPSGHLLVGGYQKRPGVTPTDFAILRLFGDPDRIFADGFDGRGFD